MWCAYYRWENCGLCLACTQISESIMEDLWYNKQQWHFQIAICNCTAGNFNMETFVSLAKLWLIFGFLLDLWIFYILFIVAVAGLLCSRTISNTFLKCHEYFHHILNSVLGFMIYCGGNEGDRNYIELFSDVYWSAYWLLSNVTCLIINLTLSSNTFCSDFWLNFLGFSNCWSWRKSQQCYSLLQTIRPVCGICLYSQTFMQACHTVFLLESYKSVNQCENANFKNIKSMSTSSSSKMDLLGFWSCQTTGAIRPAGPVCGMLRPSRHLRIDKRYTAHLYSITNKVDILSRVIRNTFW